MPSVSQESKIYQQIQEMEDRDSYFSALKEQLQIDLKVFTDLVP